jgi:hypothetical protein
MAFVGTVLDFPTGADSGPFPPNVLILGHPPLVAAADATEVSDEEPPMLALRSLPFALFSSRW